MKFNKILLYQEGLSALLGLLVLQSIVGKLGICLYGILLLFKHYNLA